jgi:hypothetical protein
MGSAFASSFSAFSLLRDGSSDLTLNANYAALVYQYFDKQRYKSKF